MAADLEARGDGEARKRQLIDVLTDRYARDELPMEEYERLVADIHRAQNPAELAVVAEIVSGSRGEMRKGTETQGERYSVQRPENIQNEAAVLTERRHTGSWLRKRSVAAITFLASQVFDFRDVPLPAGETLLEIFAFLGSVDIIVPDDLAVRMEVVPIAGDASMGRGVLTHERDGRPILVIAGSAVLGSVTVKAR
jgi:hypothetical protein